MDYVNLYPILFPIILTGLASGLIAGLFGVGGGIILVPAIVFALDYIGQSQSITMHMAVATSLAIIIPTSISSIIAHNKNDAVDYNIIFNLSPGIFIFAIFGSFLTQIVSGDTLRLLFASIALISSINMMKKFQFVLGNKMPLNRIFNFFVGSIIGFLSSMIGIGGGAISVPMMNSFSVSHHRSIGTASALGLVISVPAAITYACADTSSLDMPEWSIGMISLPIIIIFIPLTIFASQIGANIAHLLNELFLRRIFSVFILLMSIRMIYQVIV